MSLIETLIPDSVRDDNDAHRAAQFIVGFLVAIAACCFVYQGFYRMAGNPGGANLIVVEGLLAMGLIALLRRTGWVRLVAQLFFVSFVALVTLLCLTMGGFSFVGLMPLLWALTIPLGALLTLGQGAGLAWVAVVGLDVTAIWLLHGAGVNEGWPVQLGDGSHLFFVWIHIFGLGFMITALGLLFEAANRSALGAALDAQAEAREMADQLAVEKASVEAKVEEATRQAEARGKELHDAVVAVLGEMEGFAHGDLTVSFPDGLEGEMGELAHGLNRTTRSLEDLMRELALVAEDTARASSQMDQAAGALVHRTEGQARTICETRHTVEGIAGRILETADQATRTAEMAQGSSQVARDGSVVVGETLDRIRGIAEIVAQASEKVEHLGEESRRISEVVATVEDIAAQTHMLALNASIEAARAGEHGKGFAVVADEVRELADRTARATHEIAATSRGIEGGAREAVDSMARGREAVDEGVRLSDEAGRALERIVHEMESMVQLVQEIATASRDQAQASGSVVDRMGGAAEAAQASVEDVAGISRTSAELQRLTDQLRSRVAEFQVGEADVASAAPDGQGVSPLKAVV